MPDSVDNEWIIMGKGITEVILFQKKAISPS